MKKLILALMCAILVSGSVGLFAGCSLFNRETEEEDAPVMHRVVFEAGVSGATIGGQASRRVVYVEHLSSLTLHVPSRDSVRRSGLSHVGYWRIASSVLNTAEVRELIVTQDLDIFVQWYSIVQFFYNDGFFAGPTARNVLMPLGLLELNYIPTITPRVAGLRFAGWRMGFADRGQVFETNVELANSTVSNPNNVHAGDATIRFFAQWESIP